MKQLVWSLCVLWVVTLVGAQGQQGRTKEEKKLEIPHGMIGLEAHREVIASGSYLIGPGDEFLFYVPGMENPAPSRVLAEGVLYVPQVGMIKVGGLPLTKARQAIEQAFRQIFKVGKLELALSNLRFFPIQVVGLVGEPGIAVATGIERVTEVINKRGGLQPLGSRRNIRLFKTAHLTPEVLQQVQMELKQNSILTLRGLESQRVDLLMYEFSGNSKYNPYVEDGDIILVPPPAGRVGSVGAFQRSGFFEYIKGERISDLVVFSMGLAVNYDHNQALLFRYSEDGQLRLEIPVDIDAVLAGDTQADLLLQPDDWLVLRIQPDYHPATTVNISGEVLYPGVYLIERRKTTLLDIIERAGGITEDASLQAARMTRAQTFNLEDPVAAHISTIPVADRTELDNQYFTMKSREKPTLVVDFYALIEEGDKEQNIRLKPGDSIFIPERTGTVLVSGHAASSGALNYNPDYRTEDYIKRAGGLTWRASKDVLVIKASTGEIKPAKDVKKIEPGDRIWIREKPERKYWDLFTDVMAVVGQVSTVVLLYVSITK
jgi:polysaccharide export outer membrane protein